MVLATTTVASRGRIKIPGELMERYEIEPGGRVAFVDLGTLIAIVPENERAEETVRRLLADPGSAAAGDEAPADPDRA